MKNTIGTIAAVFLASAGVYTQTPKPAVPTEPITSILSAFKTHPIVALGEGDHGNEQGHAFRLALIRDPRFAATVNDIVVEFGNARYQDVIDRFTTGGRVPESELLHVWQDTIGSPGPLVDLPIYEEFFRAVRDLNASLPRSRQLRVLLGDPPADWIDIHTYEDLLNWAPLRDHFPAELIQREVLAKHRRALLIYGDMHLRRKGQTATNTVEDPRTHATVDTYTLIDLVESESQPKAFTIWTNTDSDLSEVQPDVTGWPIPSLAILAGNKMGASDFSAYHAGPMPDATVRMEDKFDAILYVGPRSAITKSRLSPALCRDGTYINMRLTRMALVGMPAEIFRQYCSHISK